jgi:hypothetical protein
MSVMRPKNDTSPKQASKIWRTNTNSLSYLGFRYRLVSIRPCGRLTGRFTSGVSTLSVTRHDGCRPEPPRGTLFNRARLGQAWEKPNGRSARIVTPLG